jgi:hypothetical protein
MDSNACHIDSLIVALHPFFITKMVDQYPKGTFKRKLCKLVHKLDEI